MAEGDIIRSETGREYILGPYLTSGLIGVVYPALSTDTQRTRVAVKLPAPNLNKDALARFHQEYDILSKLSARLGAPLQVPWVERGTNLRTDEPALIMEFLGDEAAFSRRLPSPDEKPFEREQMLLKAAEQYARLLVALHSLHYTCLDRKLTDFRWLEDVPGGRLVVLDWNVVREGPEGIPDDLYLFGVLWYQMLAGRYPSDNLNPLNDMLWRGGKVSYGTRRLMLKALQPQRSERFSSAAELLEALQKRLELLAKSTTELTALALPVLENLRRDNKLVEGTLEQIRRTGDVGREIPQIHLEQEQQVLDWLDIAQRKGRDDLAQEYDEVLKLVRRQGDRLVDQIEHAFRITRYDLGSQAARWATRIGEETHEPRLKLRLARWDLLIQAGQQAMTEGLGLREVREALAGWLRQFETLHNNPVATEANWMALTHQFEPLLGPAQLPAESQTRKVLQNLSTEAYIHGVYAAVQQAELAGNYTEAQKRFPALLEYLQKHIYRATIQADLGDLDACYVDLEQAARLQEITHALAKEEDGLQELLGMAPAWVQKRMDAMGSYVDVSSLATMQTEILALRMLIEAWQTPDVLKKLDDWRTAIEKTGAIWRNEAANIFVRQYAAGLLLKCFEIAERLDGLKVRSSENDQLALTIYQSLLPLGIKESTTMRP